MGEEGGEKQVLSLHFKIFKKQLESLSKYTNEFTSQYGSSPFHFISPKENFHTSVLPFVEYDEFERELISLLTTGGALNGVHSAQTLVELIKTKKMYKENKIVVLAILRRTRTPSVLAAFLFNGGFAEVIKWIKNDHNMDGDKLELSFVQYLLDWILNIVSNLEEKLEKSLSTALRDALIDLTKYLDENQKFSVGFDHFAGNSVMSSHNLEYNLGNKNEHITLVDSVKTTLRKTITQINQYVQGKPPPITPVESLSKTNATSDIASPSRISNISYKKPIEKIKEKEKKKITKHDKAESFDVFKEAHSKSKLSSKSNVEKPSISLENYQLNAPKLHLTPLRKDNVHVAYSEDQGFYEDSYEPPLPETDIVDFKSFTKSLSATIDDSNPNRKIKWADEKDGGQLAHIKEFETILPEADDSSSVQLDDHLSYEDRKRKEHEAERFSRLQKSSLDGEDDLKPIVLERMSPQVAWPVPKEIPRDAEPTPVESKEKKLQTQRLNKKFQVAYGSDADIPPEPDNPTNITNEPLHAPTPIVIPFYDENADTASALHPDYHSSYYDQTEKTSTPIAMDTTSPLDSLPDYVKLLSEIELERLLETLCLPQYEHLLQDPANPAFLDLVESIAPGTRDTYYGDSSRSKRSYGNSSYDDNYQQSSYNTYNSYDSGYNDDYHQYKSTKYSHGGDQSNYYY